jgi:penicillin-binding protein 2
MALKWCTERGRPGAAVVMNPQTGEVLALASSPGFDPNTFLPSGKSEERTRLLNDPRLPLFNRAIQALYPPGSTFKIVTSLAELEEHAMNPNESVRCTGSYTLGLEKRIFRCWKSEGHGWFSFHQALAHSCDVYFYQAGLKLGAERIEKYAKAAGLGKRTGIDLPAESRGSLPFGARAGKYWVGGETLNYAIGQGGLQVTALQMANVAAMAGNRGVAWQPYIASESRRFGERSERLSAPREWVRVTASAHSWKLLTDSLEEVVRSGTGVASKLPDVRVAGKTGTAQATKGNDHAWFVAYAPSDQPQVACAVLVEHGGHGGAVAAPIAHDLLAQALGVANVPAAQSVSESMVD